MSMAFLPEDEERQDRQWLRIAGPVAVLILIGLGVWWFAHQQTAVERQANNVSTLLPVTLPPPPPPPPKPIEQPKPVEQQVIQPTNTPPPPQQAAQTPQANAPVEQNSTDLGGASGFDLAGGTGNGMMGSGGIGFAETAGQYGQYARGKILAAVKQDDTLHGKEFLAVVKLWFNAQGAIAKVEITKPTGTDAYDSELQKILSGLSGFSPPSATVIGQMPIQFTIDERQS